MAAAILLVPPHSPHRAVTILLQDHDLPLLAAEHQPHPALDWEAFIEAGAGPGQVTGLEN
jgi:hypothetical protein